MIAWQQAAVCQTYYGDAGDSGKVFVSPAPHVSQNKGTT